MQHLHCKSRENRDDLNNLWCDHLPLLQRIVAAFRRYETDVVIYFPLKNKKLIKFQKTVRSLVGAGELKKKKLQRVSYKCSLNKK